MNAETKAKIIEDAAIGLWNKVKGFFQDLDAHEEINMGIAYGKYLQKTSERNRKIKTLIYRHVPKDLYSFYECTGVSCNGKIVQTDDVRKLINISNRLIITGLGGMGKTILLKHLFLNTIDKTKYIPVLIELRSVNYIDVKEISIYEIIYENMCNNGFEMEKKYFEYSLEKGGYVILLDGYDEVNQDKAQKVTTEIRGLCNKYTNNKFIITSRPSDSFIGWSEFVEVNSLELSKLKALKLISRIEFDERVKDKFYNELDKYLYDKYQSFASNPLLLTIMLLTYESRASIPDKLNDFYEQAFATLFNMHDATKEEYVRDIRSKLGYEDFKLIFAYFCFKSYFGGHYEFTEALLNDYINKAKEKFENINFDIKAFRDDLVQSVCMLVKDGLNYRFTHRSFQEYFAAWYCCKLVDDDQRKLIIKWLKGPAMYNDTFLTMLFNLQSEKVNKIILAPGLRQVKEKYLKHGLSVALLKEFYDSVFFSFGEHDDEPGIAVGIKNSYLCGVIRHTCRLNGHVIDTSYLNSNVNFMDKVKSYGDRDINFDELLEVATEEEILDGIGWFVQQLIFALEVLEKNDVKKTGNIRNVASILENL